MAPRINNRRAQRTPAAPNTEQPADAAPAVDETPAAPVTEQDAPATDTDTDAVATVNADAAPTPTGEPDASPAPAQADAEQEPDAAPPVTESDPVNTEQPTDAAPVAEPEPVDYLAVAVSMTATQDARRTALTAYAVTSARIALETLAARKDDEIIRTDTFTFRPDSASGRGPSLARIISMMAQALFGAGFVSDGNCHKSTQTNPIFEEVVIPVLFRPFFTALVTALDAPGGYIRTAEKVVTTSARQVIKEHGTGNRTVYNMTNKASRIQMETAGAELAADIAAQFPADDPQIITIREVIAATTAELTRHSAGKLSYLHTPTDRYAVKQELATASA